MHLGRQGHTLPSSLCSEPVKCQHAKSMATANVPIVWRSVQHCDSSSSSSSDTSTPPGNTGDLRKLYSLA